MGQVDVKMEDLAGAGTCVPDVLLTGYAAVLGIDAHFGAPGDAIDFVGKWDGNAASIFAERVNVSVGWRAAACFLWRFVALLGKLTNKNPTL